MIDGPRIPLRVPVGAPEKRHELECPCREGYVSNVNRQDTVRCVACNAFLYNAPKTETGRSPRTVTTVHNGIKPKQRARILARDGGRCGVCHRDDQLHVGHVVAVAIGLTFGLTETELNSDENLMAMCDECNLGFGSTPLPMKLLVTNLMALIRKPPVNEKGSKAG